MFDLLEKSARLDITSLDIWLKRTSQEVEARLSKKPILVLTYRQVPLLLAKDVLSAIGNHIEAKFQAISNNLLDPQSPPNTLFIVQANSIDLSVPIWSQIAKKMVESKGKARFIVLVSQRKFEEFQVTSLYVLLKPYYDRLDKVSENPAALLESMTAMKSLPLYKERRLPELMFFAAACVTENEGLGENELLDIIRSINLIEFDGQTKCCFPWRSLPRLEKLLNLYFDSIELKPEHRLIARSDQDFYLGALLSSFGRIGHRYELEKALVGMPPAEREKISKIIALKKRQESFPTFGKVLSFLLHLSITYTIAQGADPKQYMGITGEGITDEPASRRELKWVSQNVFHLGDEIDNDQWEKIDWKKTGELIQPHLLNIASSGSLELEATAERIKGLAEEFSSRIESYTEQECKSLSQKTLDTAYLIECSAALNSSTIPRSVAGSFSALWSKCLERLHETSVFTETELSQVKKKIRQLRTLNPRYEVANRRFEEQQVQNQIALKVEENKQADDRIDHFFSLFASLLREHDFFLDKAVSKRLAPKLATLYLELDNQLLQGAPPFSEDFRNEKDLTSLVASLADADFDRVFILIIDALSYLDWKLSRDEYADLDSSVQISEEYRLSPLPTYTPCALTALITGYHPSLTGICHWKLKTADGDIIDLKSDTPQYEKVQSMSLPLPKRNCLTLIHSQGKTPLTVLQERLANLISIPLPSSEHEKSITQVTERINSIKYETKLVAIYIADFDEFGHWYLSENGFHQYYSVQSERIKNELLKPIFRRAEKKSESTLVVLTADHGKLTRYENRILSMVLPESNAFQACASMLSKYDHCRSPRFIISWIPDGEIEAVVHDLQASLTEGTDISIFSDQTLKRFFPYESQTQFMNPNLIVLSRFGTGGQPIAHGGASLSEVVVPTISFKCNGG